MKTELFNDDCLNVLKTMDNNSIDSCVTDPPYGLSFMGKSWDYDVPQKKVWGEVFRVLKPGAHLLAFFGSRTYHRGAVQIEDAGFEIRDQIMWLYGSGFPKSHNIGKAIDKDMGTVYPKNTIVSDNNSMSGGNYTRHTIEIQNELAKQWDGWGTALKPAHEPIVVARKPITQTVAKNVLEYGTGAINIDDCRVVIDPVGDASQLRTMKRNLREGVDGWGMTTVCGDEPHVLSPDSRWPANVIHDGSDEVVSKFPNSKSRFFYCAKASKSDREDGNNHPTVKPTELMKYLCRLITPPNGIVLDPFMGSGSTGKAALQEGFKFVGIEMNKEYYEIAQNRLSSLDNFFE
jgi:adenine-specific DNA-methyltransferase